MELIAITDDAGGLQSLQWLQKAESVHRQLRPQLPVDYAAKMQRVFAQGGRMVVAAENDTVLGVAVWRTYENTAYGVQVYVDDLVSDDTHRSQGVGHALIAWLNVHSKTLGASVLTLDSGTHRVNAHRFYLRERFDITSFHFTQKLESP